LGCDKDFRQTDVHFVHIAVRAMHMHDTVRTCDWSGADKAGGVQGHEPPTLRVIGPTVGPLCCAKNILLCHTVFLL